MDRLEEILQRASAVLSKSRKAHRDARLEVGGLLREYLIEWLKGVDDQTRDNRNKLNLSRRHAIKRAAQVLNTSPRAINEFVRNYNVVRLLADGGNVGSITYSTISAFSVLISFPPGMYRRSVNSQGNAPSVREEWFVIPPVEENVSLFREAVFDSWTVEKARKVLREREKNKRGSKNVVRAYNNVALTREVEQFRPEEMVRCASPGDTVEVLYSMVMSAEDPLSIVERLLQKVKSSPLRLLRV